MISFASVKGPSVNVIFPLARRARAPKAVGSRPPIPTIAPFLAASSPSLPIFSMSAGDGRAPVAGAHREDRQAGGGGGQERRDGRDGGSAAHGLGSAGAPRQREDHVHGRPLYRGEGNHRRVRDLRCWLEEGSPRVDTALPGGSRRPLGSGIGSRSAADDG